MDLEAKLDKIAERLGDMAVTAAAQHVTLKQHSQRSSELEAEVDILKQAFAEFRGAVKFLNWAMTLTCGGVFAVVVEVILLHWRK